MESEQRPPSIGLSGPGGPEAGSNAPELRPAFGVNETAELVLDLLGRTALVAPDVLALVRGRTVDGASVTQALMDEGAASADGVAHMLAARHHLPIVDLASVGVAADAAQLISVNTLERAVAVPYAFDEDVLKIAVADPGNLHAIDELRLATRHTLELSVASREDIVLELQRLMRAAEAVGTVAFEVEESDELADDLDAEDGVSDGPLVRLVNALIFQAAEEGASDVHFEPHEDALVVRFRVDGVLREVQRIPKRMAAGVTTRLKVLSKLDIAERRKPQDGRITLSTAAVGRMLDIRLATLPTVEGEKVVMRLLDKSSRPPTLIELGLSESMREGLARVIALPTGALLVTGPDRLGQVDDALRVPRADQPARDQHHHRRGPRRVPAGRRQPGADQRARRSDVRVVVAFDPALGPRRGHGRGDPGRRDGEDLRRGRPHGPLRPLDAAHERRTVDDHAPRRDGRRAVPDRRRRVGRPRPASRAQALHALLRGLHADGERAPRGACLARGRPPVRRHGLLSQARLPEVQPHGLSRPRSASTSC